MSYTDTMHLLEKEARRLSIPFVGNFELTYRCNLHCPFCYTLDRDRQPRELSAQQWKRIFSEMSSLGLTRATFTGGEVFVRSDLEELYCTTYDLGVRITLLTNGLLIKEKDCQYLKKRLPEGVSISVYGASDADYHRITGDSDGFQKVKASIALLKQYGIPVSLKAPALPALKEQLPDIRQFACDEGLKITLTKYISPTSFNKGSDFRLTPDEVSYYAALFDNANDIMGGVTESDNCCSIASCNAGKGRFAVTAHGNMMGCICYPEIQVPLGDGPCSAALETLRQRLRAKTEPCTDCLSCPSRSHCGKCGGLNYMETGCTWKCSEYRKELAKRHLI